MCNIKNISIMFMVAISIMGCSKYTAEQQPADTIIPNSSIMSVELKDSHHLLPNQEASITLSVNKIGDLKVTDTFISGTSIVDLNIQRASIKANSITFEANGKQKTIDMEGNVVDRDGKLGIPVGCGKEDISNCGVLDYINSDGWSITTLTPIDVSNVHVMVDRS